MNKFNDLLLNENSSYDVESAHALAASTFLKNKFEPRNELDEKVYTFAKRYAEVTLSELAKENSGYEEDQSIDEEWDEFLTVNNVPLDETLEHPMGFCRDYYILTLLDYRFRSIYEISDDIAQYSK